MRWNSITVSVVYLLAMPSPVLAADDTTANEMTKAPLVNYGSPQGVFEAYCRALETSDWPTVYACCTIDNQDAAVSALADQLFFNREREPKYDAILKKHGIDCDLLFGPLIPSPASNMTAAPAPAGANPVPAGSRETPRGSLGPAEPVVSDPGIKVPTAPAPVDFTATWNTAVQRITDKVAFFTEANEIIRQKNRHFPRPRLGKLGAVQITGDTALGHVSVTNFYLEFVDGREQIQEFTQIERIHFSRRNGKWFLGKQ